MTRGSRMSRKGMAPSILRGAMAAMLIMMTAMTVLAGEMVTVTGPILNTQPGTIVVGEDVMAVTDHTIIRNVDGEEVPLASLAKGQWVRIEAMHGDGRFEAFTVRALPGPPPRGK